MVGDCIAQTGENYGAGYSGLSAAVASLSVPVDAGILETKIESGFENIWHARTALCIIGDIIRVNGVYGNPDNIILSEDTLILTNLPFTGGSTPLVGIEKRNRRFVLVDYDGISENKS